MEKLQRRHFYLALTGSPWLPGVDELRSRKSAPTTLIVPVRISGGGKEVLVIEIG